MKISDEQVKRIAELWNSGMSAEDIADCVNVTSASVRLISRGKFHKELHHLFCTKEERKDALENYEIEVVNCTGRSLVDTLSADDNLLAISDMLIALRDCQNKNKS